MFCCRLACHDTLEVPQYHRVARGVVTLPPSRGGGGVPWTSNSAPYIYIYTHKFHPPRHPNSESWRVCFWATPPQIQGSLATWLGPLGEAPGVCCRRHVSEPRVGFMEGCAPCFNVFEPFVSLQLYSFLIPHNRTTTTTTITAIPTPTTTAITTTTTTTTSILLFLLLLLLPLLLLLLLLPLLLLLLLVLLHYFLFLFLFPSLFPFLLLFLLVVLVHCTSSSSTSSVVVLTVVLKEVLV